MVLTEDSFLRREYKEILIYIIIGVIMTILIPIFIGFSLKAFEESFQPGTAFSISDTLGQYLVYFIFIIASLTLIVFPLARLLVISRNEHPATQKNPTFFRILTVSMIFAPEENGFLYWVSEKLGFSGKKNIMKWSLSLIRVFIVATLIFATFGMLQAIAPELQVTAIPQVTLQQITFTSQLFFAAEPPSWSETMTMGIVLFLLMGIVAYISARFGLGKAGFYGIGLLLVCPLIGVAWASFHNIVYGNSEASLFATFIFGWLGATLTILTGTIFFWYIWHFWNNIFVKLRELVPRNEDIIFISIVCIVTLLLLWIGTEIAIRQLKKKRNPS